MKKLTYLLLCLVLGIGLATAQTRKVTGTVISAEDSEPIIGASVIVKGTTTGTVTDFDGAFSWMYQVPRRLWYSLMWEWWRKKFLSSL